MIIEMLLSLLGRLLDLLLVFNIPKLPAEVNGYIETMFEYLEMGAGILANYTPLGYLLTLMGIILAVDAGIMIYHFVMWIIRKIPMLSMS